MSSTTLQKEIRMAKGKKRRQRQGVEDLSNYARKAGQCRIKFEDEAFTAAFSQTARRFGHSAVG
jgi:hypothetical protein